MRRIPWLWRIRGPSFIFGGTDVKKSLWGWVLICILSTASLVFSQTATTSLRGVIKDPSRCTCARGHRHHHQRRQWPDPQHQVRRLGSVHLYADSRRPSTPLPSRHNGFGDQSKTAELLVNQPATIDFAITVQAATVTVDVSASAQTLNITDASLGNSD